MNEGGAQIGYNAAKINTLMGSISDAYVALASKVKTNYETLKPVLRKEWVGEDELDFEQKLVTRLNNMYYNAGLLSQAAINAIYNVATSWKEFQSKNIFGGEGASVNINVTFDEVTVTLEESLITFTGEEYGSDVNRGLQSGEASYTNIMEALEQFRTSSRTDAQNFTSEFDINSAFFGGSEQGINSFLEHLEGCLGAVLTAVKDFVDGLQNLAKTNYVSATSTINEYADTSKKEIDDVVVDSTQSEQGSTRWSDSN